MPGRQVGKQYAAGWSGARRRPSPDPRHTGIPRPARPVERVSPLRPMLSSSVHASWDVTASSVFVCREPCSSPLSTTSSSTSSRTMPYTRGWSVTAASRPRCGGSAGRCNCCPRRARSAPASPRDHRWSASTGRAFRRFRSLSAPRCPVVGRRHRAKPGRFGRQKRRGERRPSVVVYSLYIHDRFVFRAIDLFVSSKRSFGLSVRWCRRWQ